MYTGLRVSVVVKPEYRAAIARLHAANDARVLDPQYAWDRVYEAFPVFPGSGTWSAVGRRDFLPFGGLTYMPDGFSEIDKQYSHFNEATGQWKFCASLKNYRGEIQTFVDQVLGRIVEAVAECRSLYEEYGRDRPWQEAALSYLEDKPRVAAW